MKKKIAIIQARMGSTRMPGKTLADLLGKPALWHLLENIKPSRELTNIIIATTDKKEDDAIEEFARENGATCFRGSEENVLNRFYEAAKSIGASDADIIVRITADDIFMDPYILDSFIELLESTYPHYTFVSNSLKPGFPYGMYFELFDFASLKEAHENAKTDAEKEHVTPYIRERQETFPAISVEAQGADLSDVYLSIDTPEDFERAKKIIRQLESAGKKHPFRLNDVVDAYKNLTLSKTSI